MPIRERYTKQKLNRDFNNAGPGNVIRFPDGENEGEPEEALYVPQKFVVLTAGNDDDVQMLCHAEKGLGEKAPELTSIEMMKWLCDLPDQAPKDTNFVWYAGSYDASHILKDLSFELGWEIVRQMSFNNRGLGSGPING